MWSRMHIRSQCNLRIFVIEKVLLWAVLGIEASYKSLHYANFDMRGNVLCGPLNVSGKFCFVYQVILDSPSVIVVMVCLWSGSCHMVMTFMEGLSTIKRQEMFGGLGSYVVTSVCVCVCVCVRAHTHACTCVCM